MNYDVVNVQGNAQALKAIMYDPKNPSSYNYDNSMIEEKENGFSGDEIVLYIAIPIVFTLMFTLAGVLGYFWYRQRKLSRMAGSVQDDFSPQGSKRVEDLVVEEFDGEKYNAVPGTNRTINGVNVT